VADLLKLLVSRDHHTSCCFASCVSHHRLGKRIAPNVTLMASLPKLVPLAGSSICRYGRGRIGSDPTALASCDDVGMIMYYC
jgi:hypothetical protein